MIIDNGSLSGLPCRPIGYLSVCMRLLFVSSQFISFQLESDRLTATSHVYCIFNRDLNTLLLWTRLFAKQAEHQTDRKTDKHIQIY